METPTNTIRPKLIRRLGLSRNRGNFSTPKSTQKDVTDGNETADTPKTSTDVVNSRTLFGNSVERKNSVPSSTPKPLKTSFFTESIICNETPVSSRTNCTKVKLSLGNAACAMLQKRKNICKSESIIQPKRLKLDESIKESSSTSYNCDSSNKSTLMLNETNSKDSLTNAIAELKSTIQKLRKHKQRSAELIALISKWRQAGKRAIDELKEKLEPKQDAKAILEHFQINPDLFNAE